MRYRAQCVPCGWSGEYDGEDFRCPECGMKLRDVVIVPHSLLFTARRPLQPKRMNQLEYEYARLLTAQAEANQIHKWRFEAVKLRLGDQCWYMPDFWIELPDGRVELHETKGHWRDDAKAKIRVAAELYPEFRFFAVEKKRKKDGGGFKLSQFDPWAVGPSATEAV